MHAPSVISLLAWTSLLLVSQLAATTLRLVPGLAATTVRLAVVDGQRAPIAELTLRVEDVTGQAYEIRTNGDGQAIAGPLAGPVCYIRTATLADGRPLQVEPTTAKEGLRLGLIPGQERTVRLIIDGGLLFLDPEELFPADDPAPAAPDAASLPASTSAVAASPAPAPLPATTVAAPSSTAASMPPFPGRAPSRVLITGLLVVVASTIVVLIGIIIVLRHA